MKRAIIGCAAALGLLVSSQAMAQTVTIAPQQRSVIKEYVTKERIRPAPRLKERVVVGSTLPADVELSPVPETWGPALRPYRYIYSDDRVMLVEPSSRRVIEVIE
jgi:uncharacterized protein DUF1236